MDFAALYNAADAAGKAAAEGHRPTPMIVGQAKSFFSNEIDYSQPTETINDGVCGFAWVNIKPGNSPFANFLKKMKLARKDEYYGGVTIWIGAYNQSMEKKSAYAGAFVDVLMKAGIDRCYAMSRMD